MTGLSRSRPTTEDRIEGEGVPPLPPVALWETAATLGWAILLFVLSAAVCGLVFPTLAQVAHLVLGGR